MEATTGPAGPGRKSLIQSVYVTGDPTIDWAVKNTDTLDPEDRLSGRAVGLWHRGGALLLEGLLRQALPDTVSVHGFELEFGNPANPCPSPADRSVHHSYNELERAADWEKELERAADWDKERTTRERAKGWKLRRSLGFHRISPLEKDERRRNDPTIGSEGSTMVVVDDLGNGFADRVGDVDALMERMHSDNCEWTLLRLHDVGLARTDIGVPNEIMRRVTEDFLSQPTRARNHTDKASRFIVVVDASAFRRNGVEVSQGLSWERSSQDVMTAIERHETLSRFRFVVVSFGPTGALLVIQDPPRVNDHSCDQNEGSKEEGQDGADKSSDPAHLKQSGYLRFVPSAIEEPKQRGITAESVQTGSDGNLFGYTHILTATIAKALVERGEAKWRWEDDESVIRIAMRDALVYMRKADRDGFSISPEQGPTVEFRFPTCLDKRFDCEWKKWRCPRLGEARIRPKSAGSPSGHWSILDDVAREDGQAYITASAIARDSLETPPGVPYARFHELVVVDRREVEAFRTVFKLVANYLNDRSQNRPLSVAAFGAPGDGKSFAVKELVMSLHGHVTARLAEDPLEFNLSQLNSATDLTYALHQVQDGTSGDIVPLVFWDEFDTALDGQPLGWLRHFLSPMQDGTFQERDSKHPIGRALFVFAGGTVSTYHDFVARATAEDTRHAKGLDFLSRLSGYLEIVGPNPRNGDFVDFSKYIYRAVLLRRELKSRGITKIDDEVLSAFLRVSRYRHGARSLRAIVGASTVSPGGRFVISWLPPETQLDLHVDANEFLRRARGSREE